MGTYGLSGAFPSLEDFARVAQSLGPLQSVSDPKPHCFDTTSPSGVVDLNYLFHRDSGGELSAAAYACCLLEVPEAKSIWLLSGRYGALEIFLNGKSVFSSERMEVFAGYSGCCAIQLKPGRNLLAVKIGRRSYGDWGYGLAWAATAVDAATLALERQGTLESSMLRSDIVKSIHELRLSIAGAPADVIVPFDVVDLLGKVRAQFASGSADEISSGTENLPPGLYRAVIKTPGRLFSQTFILGDPLNVITLIAEEIRQGSLTPSQLTHVESLLERIRTLMQSPLARELNMPDKVAEWSRQVVHWTLDASSAARGESTANTGLRTAVVRSEIDSSDRIYRLYVPSAAQQHAVPLVVMVSPAVTANVPYFKSSAVSSYNGLIAAEVLAQSAERLGMAVVWPGYRRLPHGHPAEFTHLDEVLTDVARHMKIDPQRVYLTGACASGTYASMAIVRWPKRFAACGLLHPAFARATNGEDMDTWSINRNFPAYTRWCRENNPIPAIYGQFDVPYYLIWDGALPNHASIGDSFAFAQGARPYKFQLQFERQPKLMNGEDGEFERLLLWFSELSRTDVSSEREPSYFSTSRRLGPLSRLFAESTVLVMPNGEQSPEAGITRRLADDFQRVWQDTNQSKCPERTERDFKLDATGVENAVLLGNTDSSPLWRDLAKASGLAVGPHEIKIKERTFNVTSGAVVFMARNPANPSRAVVLLGGSNLSCINRNCLKSIVDGWFDYAVWSKGELIAAGRLE